MTLHKNNATTIHNEKLKVSLAASFLLSLTLFFFGPVNLYYTNIQEMPFSLSNIWYYILAIVLFVGFILSILLWWLKGSIHTTASTLVFALGLLFWIQGNILVWNYGLLDGHEIIFENYFWNGVIDSLVWIGVLIVGFLYSKRLYRHIAVLCSLLIIAQAAGLMVTAYSAPGESEWKNLQDSSDHRKMYEFSTNMNVIIIILDAFQSDIFQEIIDENPEYKNMFDGFTYYRNNVAGFPFTTQSIMYILSGKLYDNSVPFSQFIENTSLHNSLPHLLKENGVRVDIQPGILCSIFPSSEIYDTIDGFSWKKHAGFSAGNISEITPIYRLTFFRFVPQALKQYLYRTSFAELSSVIPNGAIQDDMAVYSNFNTAIRVSAPERVFKLFHLKGAHPAYDLNENLSYMKLPQNITGYKSQAKASLKISHALLESLKRNNSYGNSLIFIIGDHGSGATTDADIINDVPARGIPLMLVKPFNSTGTLAISDSPVSLGDISKTIADELKINNCLPGSSIFSVKETDSRLRIFYSYQDIINGYPSPLREYQISGFSWNTSSWEPTYREYTSEGVKYVKRTYQPVVGDWNGDGKDELGNYDGIQIWAVDYNGNGTWDDGTRIDRKYSFGIPTDLPVVGDWNGDGKDEIGNFKGDGVWALDCNGDGAWDGNSTDRIFVFGGATDLPVVGDWNSDGKDEIGNYKGDGVWALDYNGNGAWDGNSTDRVYAFSSPADKPVVGDWNSDGKDEIGNYKGDGVWALDYNGNGAWDGTSTDRVFVFGESTDQPVVGDWNGDGKDELGNYKGNGIWALDYNGNEAWDGTSTDRVFVFGSPTDKPVVGRW